VALLKGGEADGLQLDIPDDQHEVWVTVLDGQAVAKPDTAGRDTNILMNRAGRRWQCYGRIIGADIFEVIVWQSWWGFEAHERARVQAREERAGGRLPGVVETLARGVRRLST
jgi:hypothetical protein